MDFDYLYAHEAEQFTFYRIPKVLFTNDIFKSVSAEAKTLYGILLDRVSLSKKNGWIDEYGRVYIIYTIDEIMESLNCANQKASKLLNELKDMGLIECKRQGLGKPNIIYVKNFSRNLESPSHFQKCENHISRIMKITHQEMLKSHANNTNNSNTDLSDNLSHNKPQFFCTLKLTNNGEIDENCRNCYLINSCPFKTRCPNCSEVLDPECLSDSEIDYMMNQLFLHNPYYNISERIKNKNITDLEAEYFGWEDE